MMAEAQELDPAEEEHHDEERREALRRERGIDEPEDDLRECSNDRDADRYERQPGDQIQRRVGERQDGAPRPLDVLPTRSWSTCRTVAPAGRTGRLSGESRPTRAGRG